jgi:hypothetical protein
VARHYALTLETNPEQTQVTRLSWEKKPVEGMMLSDQEAVFRSLKSELRLRPVCHLKAERADLHLFISVLAYQCVQLIRRQLKAKGMDQRWSGLRETLSVQRRVTARFVQSVCRFALHRLRTNMNTKTGYRSPEAISEKPRQHWHVAGSVVFA